MTNLLGLIISISIIIWGLSVIWSVKEMVYSPLNNYKYSPVIISFVGVMPIINTLVAIILTINKNINNMKNPFKRKMRILEDCVVQDTILNIGKSLLLVIGYTDSYYSAFGYVHTQNTRLTEDLVLKDKTAPYDSPKRWVRYKYFKLCTLPFNIKYKWKGIDKIFKIHPEIWIKLNKIK